MIPVTNESSGQKTKKDRSGEILDSALEVFTEVGYHRARVEEIAKRAGVAKGTIYLYFSSKKELFQALVERMTGIHLDKIKQARDSAMKLRSKLLIVAQTDLELFNSHDDMAKLNFLEIFFTDNELRDKILDFRDHYRAIIANILSGPAAPSPYHCDAATAFIGMLNSFELELIHSRRQANVDTLSKIIVGLFLDGFEGRLKQIT